jgi:hypothetical protein
MHVVLSKAPPLNLINSKTFSQYHPAPLWTRMKVVFCYSGIHVYIVAALVPALDTVGDRDFWWTFVLSARFLEASGITHVYRVSCVVYSYLLARSHAAMPGTHWYRFSSALDAMSHFLSVKFSQIRIRIQRKTTEGVVGRPNFSVRFGPSPARTVLTSTPTTQAIPNMFGQVITLHHDQPQT